MNFSMMPFVRILVGLTTLVLSDNANANPDVENCLKSLSNFYFTQEHSELMNYLNAIRIFEVGLDVAHYYDVNLYYTFILREVDKMLGADKWCQLEPEEERDKCFVVLQEYHLGDKIGLKNYYTLINERNDNYKIEMTKFKRSTKHAVNYVKYMFKTKDEINFLNPLEWCSKGKSTFAGVLEEK